LFPLYFFLSTLSLERSEEDLINYEERLMKVSAIVNEWNKEKKLKEVRKSKCNNNA